MRSLLIILLILFFISLMNNFVTYTLLDRSIKQIERCIEIIKEKSYV